MNSTVVIADEVHAARHLCETGEWPELLDIARTWQKNNPNDHLAFFYAGLAHSELGQFMQADTAYRRAIELNESDAKVWYNLADLLYKRLRRPQEAIRCMEQALKLDPTEKLGWANLAYMVGRRGDHNGAMTFAARAIELDSQFVEAYLLKGAAAQALGNNDILREICGALSAIPPEKFQRTR